MEGTLDGARYGARLQWCPRPKQVPKLLAKGCYRDTDCRLRAAKYRCLKVSVHAKYQQQKLSTAVCWDSKPNSCVLLIVAVPVAAAAALPVHATQWNQSTWALWRCSLLQMCVSVRVFGSEPLLCRAYSKRRWKRATPARGQHGRQPQMILCWVATILSSKPCSGVHSTVLSYQGCEPGTIIKCCQAVKAFCLAWLPSITSKLWRPGAGRPQPCQGTSSKAWTAELRLGWVK